MAARATAALRRDEQLLLADLVLAECVYVLESYYEVERARVAELMRAAISLPSIVTVDPASLLRALELYELERVADALRNRDLTLRCHLSSCIHVSPYSLPKVRIATPPTTPRGLSASVMRWLEAQASRSVMGPHVAVAQTSRRGTTSVTCE